MNVNRRAVLLTLFVVAVLIISIAITRRGAPTDRRTHVRVAQFADVFLYLPLYIAEDQGFFGKNGVKVDITSTGGDDKTFAAVLSGDAQFGVADPTFVAIAAAK